MSKSDWKVDLKKMEMSHISGMFFKLRYTDDGGIETYNQTIPEGLQNIAATAEYGEAQIRQLMREAATALEKAYKNRNCGN